MAPEIVLIRHATTAETRTGRLSDHGPTPLDEAGRAQAIALGRRFDRARFEAVLVSPVARAWETAELSGLAVGAERCDALVEWHYGELVGQRSDEVRARRPGWSLWVDGAPRGEDPRQVAARLEPVLERLRSATADLAVVSHGHVLRALVAGWLGRGLADAGDLVIDPASVTCLSRRHGRPCLVTLNDRSHLDVGG